MERVRDCQEKVVHSLQEYTTQHYPHMPTKFGDLLLRMPELQRVCQVRMSSCWNICDVTVFFNPLGWEGGALSQSTARGRGRGGRGLQLTHGTAQGGPLTDRERGQAEWSQGNHRIYMF